MKEINQRPPDYWGPLFGTNPERIKLILAGEYWLGNIGWFLRPLAQIRIVQSGKCSGKVPAAVRQAAPLATFSLGDYRRGYRFQADLPRVYNLLVDVFAKSALEASHKNAKLICLFKQIPRATGAPLEPKHIDPLDTRKLAPRIVASPAGSAQYSRG